ncbi:MAG: DUF5086 family protein [Steroidobacteraceae bacterium]
MRAAWLPICLLGASAMAGAAWNAPLSTPCWRVHSPAGVQRWIEIHDLAAGAATGVYHVQVLQRRIGSHRWEFRSVVAHIALTEAALRASIVGVAKERSVYPEAYEAGFKAWQDRAAKGDAAVCRTDLASCLVTDVPAPHADAR